MKHFRIFVFLPLLLIIYRFNISFADVSLPSIFSDNMVLQRDIETTIWGWADPGEEVRVNIILLLLLSSYGSVLHHGRILLHGFW